jgi:hypothetical protein
MKVHFRRSEDLPKDCPLIINHNVTHKKTTVNITRVPPSIISLQDEMMNLHASDIDSIAER